MSNVYANPPSGAGYIAEDMKRAMQLERMRHLATMPRMESNEDARLQVESSSYHPSERYAGEWTQQNYYPPRQPAYADWAQPGPDAYAAQDTVHASAASKRYVFSPGPVQSDRYLSQYHLPTPHDTYRYPVAPIEPVYVPQETEQVKKDRENDALATYYVTEITKMLVEPGQFRPGVGGQSDEIWGRAGREREAHERVGLPVPDQSHIGHWGRMGMATSPIALPSRPRARTLQYEPYDPYMLLQHQDHPRSTVVAFVRDILTRMSISPTAVITALWYLKGLGLHQGDGDKGEKIRQILHETPITETDGVLKRVSVLGLLLAGKWLDDNSFLTKSWNEVTRLPIRLIDKLERAALKDFHYSLHIPLPSWVEHITHAHAGLFQCRTEQHTATVETLLDQMISESRGALLDDPLNWVIDADFRYRLPEPAPEQHWRQSSRSLSVGSQPELDWAVEDLSADLEAERNVAALVGDDEAMMDDDDEYDFVEYDGAKPWLPPMSELKRSFSNSSALSQEAYMPRSTAYYASNPQANSSVTEVEQLVTQSCMSMYESAYEHDCELCRGNNRPMGPPSSPFLGEDELFEEDGYLEPGITIVRPASGEEMFVPGTASSATATLTTYNAPWQAADEVREYSGHEQYSVEQYDAYSGYAAPHYPDRDYKAPVTNPYNFSYTPPSHHQYPFRE